MKIFLTKSIIFISAVISITTIYAEQSHITLDGKQAYELTKSYITENDSTKKFYESEEHKSFYKLQYFIEKIDGIISKNHQKNQLQAVIYTTLKNKENLLQDILDEPTTKYLLSYYDNKYNNDFFMGNINNNYQNWNIYAIGWWNMKITWYATEKNMEIINSSCRGESNACEDYLVKKIIFTLTEKPNTNIRLLGKVSFDNIPTVGNELEKGDEIVLGCKSPKNTLISSQYTETPFTKKSATKLYEIAQSTTNQLLNSSINNPITMIGNYQIIIGDNNHSFHWPICGGEFKDIQIIEPNES